MSPTYTFRRQHDALMDLAAQLTASMQSIDSLEDAKQAARLLAKMTGVLTQHLAAEDKSLYPRLMSSSDDRLSRTARQFSEEMGGLAEAYMAFKDKWSSAKAIHEDPRGFRKEAEGVLSALARRVKRENEILYPILDKLEEKRRAVPVRAGGALRNQVTAAR